MASVTYKCPNCGGGLTFSPEHQAWECEYCLSLFTEEQLGKFADEQKTTEIPPEAVDEDSDEGGTVIYQCPSCGAEIIAEASTAATYCYYCHNPVVMAGKLTEEFKPDAILPFAIEKEQARQQFLNWAGKKKYVPQGFFTKRGIDELSGVYYPYWLGDFEYEARMEGKGEKVKITRTGKIETTVVEHYAVERQGSFAYNNVARSAFTKIQSKLADGVHPYNMEALKDYNPAYMTGFMAEKRDVESDSLTESVEQELNGYAKQSLEETAPGYNSLRTDTQGRITSTRWRQVMLPIWMLTYRLKGSDEVYYYSVNGQTGTICGKLPLDKKRLALHAGLAALAGGILMVLGGLFIW